MKTTTKPQNRRKKKTNAVKEKEKKLNVENRGKRNERSNAVQCGCMCICLTDYVQYRMENLHNELNRGDGRRLEDYFELPTIHVHHIQHSNIKLFD